MRKFLTFIFAFIFLAAFGQDSPGKYTIKNASINTQSSDFGTAFFGDDKVVFASPKQGFTLNREETTNQPFLDLYIGEVTEDGQIIRKRKLEGEVNSRYHEGMVSFTKDMKTVYFSANNYVKKKKNKSKVKSTSQLQLFKATVTEEGEWKNLVLLPFNGDKFSTGHPVLNKDDSQLYFVSDRPESIGRTDLFVVDVYEDGTYGEPRNLGPQINTKDREMFPFIGKDNVLYFSSDGYPGFGELDVYASKIFDSTVSVPINLEEPVNSEFDDFAYIIDDHKHRGYFSSNRGGGHGDDDIYSFTASPPIYIECQQEITGVTKDVETQELVSDVMIILYDEKGMELQSFISSKEEGAFDFQQPCNTTYTIKGYLEGHLVGELDIKTVNDLNAEPIEITLNLNLEDYKNNKALIASQNLYNQQDTANKSIGSDKVYNDNADIVMDEGVVAGDNNGETHAALNKKSQTSATNVNTVAAAAIATDQINEKNVYTDKQRTTETVSSSNLQEESATGAKTSVSSTTSEVVSVNSEVNMDNKLTSKDENTGLAVSSVDQYEEGKSQVNTSAIALEASENTSVQELEANTNYGKHDVNQVNSGLESEAIVATKASGNQNVDNDVKTSSVRETDQISEEESITSIDATRVNDEQNVNQLDQESSAESLVAGSNRNQGANINESNDIALDSYEKNQEEASIGVKQIENDKGLQNSDYVKEKQETESLVAVAESEEKEGKDAKTGIAMNNASETKDGARNKQVPLGAGSSESDLIHINTIYFDYNKFDIRLDAKIELEKIAVVLKEHPKSKLKVNSHTDIRGKEAYNMTLSKNRAKHTIQYLIDQGIEVGRISGEGHGESQVVEKCTKQNPCTGLQHQLNRRSEFLIIDDISDIIIAKSTNKPSSGNYAVSKRAPNSGVYLNYDFSKEREVYTVQIGAFKGDLQNDKYKKLTNLFNYKYEDGLNRYYAGIFESSTEARSYLKEMKKQGFKDAFVVGLKGTNRF